MAGEIGLGIDPVHVIRIDTVGWSMKTGYHPMAPEIGYKPMQALLEKSRDFTAIFCFNDIAAIGAIRALKDAGLSVPGDVSVVGFDDILSAAYSTPSLTTVVSPCWRWANAAQRFCSSVSRTARRTIRQRSLWRRNSSSGNQRGQRGTNG